MLTIFVRRLIIGMAQSFLGLPPRLQSSMFTTTRSRPPPVCKIRTNPTPAAWRIITRCPSCRYGEGIADPPSTSIEFSEFQGSTVAVEALLFEQGRNIFLRERFLVEQG